MQRLILSFAIASAIAASTIYAQQPSPPPAASPSPTATASPAKPATPSPTPVALAEAAWQSEAVLARLHKMVARPDPTIGAINRQLGPFAYEISSRLTENSQIVAASPPTEQLAYLESLWSTFSRTLTEWDQRLVKNAAGLEGDLQELETLEKVRLSLCYRWCAAIGNCSIAARERSSGWSLLSGGFS